MSPPSQIVTVPAIFAVLYLFVAHPPARVRAEPESGGLPAVEGAIASAVAPGPGMAGLQKVIASFRVLREQLDEIERRREELERTGDTVPEALAELDEAEAKVRASLEMVKGRLREVAAGAEAANGVANDLEPFRLEDEFNALAKPLFDEIRTATAGARELSGLRAAIAGHRARRALLERALGRTREAATASDDPEITGILEGLASQIDGELAAVEAELATDQARVREMEAAQEGWVGAFVDGFLSFVTGRGKVLALALLAGLGTFLALAFLHRQLFRRLGRTGRVGSSFSFRIAELSFAFFRTLASVAAVVLVFLAFDDWLLLTVAIILIFGVLWGAKKAFVEGYHKLQLLLNLGQVRQGERVTWNGLPYRVRSLGFYPLLENPSLSNSTVRITIEELSELRMRHVADAEPWFVTETGHWVVLSDDTYGKVVYQSPERVRIEDPGGHVKTIPTPDFLALHPTNLSYGYALATTFGIDYSHQELDYEKVATALAECVRERVRDHCTEEEIEVVFASFREASTSSLDYIVVAKLAGGADDRRLPLQRALQKGCLDACNRNGWTIPFPQLTVHRAAAEDEMAFAR